MTRQEHPPILSPSHRKLWRPIEPSIWTLEDHANQDPTVSILRTLFDQPRWLEAYHLYDERGSQLFDKICDLPEYYLTRTENAILAREATRIIASAPVDCIVELGSGSSKKTSHLLMEQIRQRQRGIFAPVDVSLTSLSSARDTIQEEFPHLTFHGLHAQYEEGISSIEKGLPTLFVFLGSTVGNFSPSEFSRFFHHLTTSMGPKDFFLLGVDRIKEAEIMEKAYDDSQGVTADFILNVFQNINRLTHGTFDRGKMRYRSWYNSERQQIEMYAVSTTRQEIRFPTFGTSFAWNEGDAILVEISRKFEPHRLQQQLRFFGLESTAHFTDPQEWFSLLLLRKSSAVES